MADPLAPNAPRTKEPPEPQDGPPTNRADTEWLGLDDPEIQPELQEMSSAIDQIYEKRPELCGRIDKICDLLVKFREVQHQTDLPEEVLSSIFSFLDPTDLWRVSQVCRSWRRIALASPLWRNLYEVLTGMKWNPSVESIVSAYGSPNPPRPLATRAVFAFAATKQLEEGEPLLHTAVRWRDGVLVRYLVASGDSNVQDTNRNGDTALHVAAMDCVNKCGLQMSQLLLTDLEADPSARSTHGWTPLLCACYKGNFRLAQMLVKHGASLDERKINGSSSLILAAFAGHLEIVKWLVKEMGCNAHEERNRKGETALLVACYNGHVKLAKWLLSEGGSWISEATAENFTALHLAAYQKEVNLVRWLTTVQGADLKAQTLSGYTPLLEAAYSGSTEMVAHFLDVGSDLSERTHAHFDAFLIACFYGHVKLVEWFAERQLCLGSRKKNGDTAAHVAAGTGRWKVLDTLRRYDLLDPTVMNNRGDTPLHCAVAKGHIDAVAYLLLCGADMRMGNSAGIRPLDLAASVEQIQSPGRPPMLRMMEAFHEWVDTPLRNTVHASEVVIPYLSSLQPAQREELSALLAEMDVILPAGG